MDEQLETDAKKGRHLDEKLIRSAVRRARNATKRGAKDRIAKEVGVHPTTLSKWLSNPKYGGTNGKATKNKVVKPKSTAKPKNVAAAKADPPQNGTSFSLRDAISKLPTNYEGLLREHIKLLIETHPEMS